MTLENITRCAKCGAEGGALHWRSSPAGAVLYDGDKVHACPPAELQELL